MGFQGGEARFALLLAVFVQLRVNMVLSRDEYFEEAAVQASLLPEQPAMLALLAASSWAAALSSARE